MLYTYYIVWAVKVVISSIALASITKPVVDAYMQHNIILQCMYLLLHAIVIIIILYPETIILIACNDPLHMHFSNYSVVKYNVLTLLYNLYFQFTHLILLVSSIIIGMALSHQR